MENMKLLVGVIIGTLVLVFGVSFLFSKQSEPVVIDQNVVVGESPHVRRLSPGEGEVQTEATAAAEASGAGVMNEAKVTVVEFSDFQCPACLAVQPLMEQIMKTYAGEVELVYRHFPLVTIHKNAEVAAIASEVVADYGKFWEFHDLLFERQDEWAELDDPKEKFEEYAGQLGVTAEQLREGMDQNVYKERVSEDANRAQALGINATPTFFVNGTKVATQNLVSTIEEAL